MRLFFENIKIAGYALLSNKIRSILTTLGIIIGVLTISLLLSIAQGVRKGITTQIEDLGSNLVAVVPGKISGSSGFNPASSFGVSTLTEDDFNTIKTNLKEIKNLSMGMLVTGTVKLEEKISSSSSIFAGTAEIINVLNGEVAVGRFFNQEDLERNEKVVVLGSETKEKLFGVSQAVGEEIELRGTKFKVIGVLKQKQTAPSFLGATFDDLVMMPITTGWEITKLKQIFRIMMQANTSSEVKNVKDKVNTLLLANHKGEEDFTVLTQDDILGIVGSILNILTAMISAIAAISLLVAGIGIMNIMIISITERTKEIGIRKALGATKTDILSQFLTESVILSSIGGIFGISISFLISQLISNYSQLPIYLTSKIILLSLGFSIVVGIIFGIAPAIKAANKQTVEALRYE